MADRTIPDDLRVVCDEMAGQDLAADDPDTLTVANASDELRSWDWPVPDEMVVFGDNGQGDSFRLWVPRDGAARPVVGADRGCVRGGLPRCGGREPRVLPACVGHLSLDDDGSDDDPYVRGLTAEQVNEFARSDRR